MMPAPASCIEPRPASATKVSIAVLAMLAVQNGLQYLWVFGGVDLVARIFGFVFHAAWLAPVVVLPVFYRFTVRPISVLRGVLGRPAHWITAVIHPFIPFGVVAGIWVAVGGSFHPDWKWITYALGSFFDMPLMYVWLLPMSLVQILFLSIPFTGPDGAHEGRKTGLVFAALLVLSNGVIIVHHAATSGVAVGIGAAAILFASGTLIARLRAVGSLAASAIPVATIPPLVLAGFGSAMPQVDALVFGPTVTNVAAVFEASAGQTLAMMAGCAVVLFLLSFLVPGRRGASGADGTAGVSVDGTQGSGVDDATPRAVE